ncbi:MAG: 4Fe-4S dicluster domain-containing protein [Acidimicrobiia bacterium]|nr:4Fe-4S dicluster domain-containing protein [Acidimicrobiia bacterium]
MAHQTVRKGYEQLADRLNRYPQGAPPSDVLYAILEMLFSEREAGLVARLPIRPFTARRAARSWKMPLAETTRILEELAGRAILVDMQNSKGETLYVLPPPMAGFFEFSMMRLRDDVDQKVLGELFYEYMNVEEDFIKALFADGETQLGRVFVQEAVLPLNNGIQVLDYERASEVIRSASSMGVGVCYCRHKMEHVGKACEAPQNICMTFNTTASSLIRHGFAREVDVAEGLDLLAEAQDNNLIQFGENIQRSVNFICNCCGCCCEAMIAARKFGVMNPVHTSNYLPVVNIEKCNGCSKCVNVCPVEAMSLTSANDPHRPRRRQAKVDEALCLGCGVCVGSCDRDGIKLTARAERVITPVDSAQRAVLMAIERGKLQNLIFDNNALDSHRVMAAILGVILKAPPAKKALASKQLQSRYVNHVLARSN